jgi:hypothetical protein
MMGKEFSNNIVFYDSWSQEGREGDQKLVIG